MDHGVFGRARMRTRIASAALALALLGALAAGAGSASAAGTHCRVAQASTTGGWGSARICWTPVSQHNMLGEQMYYATLHGAVRDTKADHRAMRLYVTYDDDNGGWGLVGYDKPLAAARGKGRVTRAVWSAGGVAHVAIKVCAEDWRGEDFGRCSAER